MLKQSDVIVTRDNVRGTYECAAIVNQHRASKVYYGYTKREAVRRFVTDVNAVLVIERITGMEARP